jgi:alkanesulfonate monooxygenase SsuD/methylene tetrahydromethanopterin reductase-like flavin-dependent oxidoreductase (luciferase family)
MTSSPAPARPRFGIYLDLRNPAPWHRPWSEHYAKNLALIRAAEEMGGESLWVSEHHFWEDGYLPQPLTFLAAVAARTNHVRLGTSILIPALRPAAQVAEEAAVVDILSNGRLDLGLGVGWNRTEFARFGADYPNRREVTAQRIEEIAELLAGRVMPPPVQDPLPLWGGYTGPLGAATAGRLGVGLLSLDRDLYAAYTAGLREAGYDESLARVAGNAQLFVCDDPDAVFERAVPHLAWQLDTYRAHGVDGTGKPAPSPVDHARLRNRASGVLPLQFVTPDQAVERLLQQTSGLPVRDIYIFANVGGMPDDLARRNVELWLTKVRPAFLATT